MAATAALVDSRKKDARREHWDRVISKARAEVEDVDNQQEKRLESLSHIAEQEAFDEGSTSDPDIRRDRPPIKLIGRTPWFQAPDLRSDTWGNVFGWACQQKQVRIASGFQDFRGFPLDLLQKLSSEQLEDLLNDRVTLRRYYGGSDCLTLKEDPPQQSFSNRKLRTLEWSIAKMVWRLLLHCSDNRPATLDRPAVDMSRSNTDTPSEGESSGDSKGPGRLCSNGANLSHSPDLICDHLQKIPQNEDPMRGLAEDRTHISEMIADASERIKSLQRLDEHEADFHDLESPRLPRYGEVQKGRQDAFERAVLNQTLRPLLRKMSSEEDSRPFLAKICHHLLACPTPLSIHTYNMLLAKFCELRNEDLVQVIWDSMRASNVRPNEATYSQLLRFFTTVDNQNQFQKCLRRMKGLDGGIAVARPEHIGPIATQRLRVRDKSTKIVEKARMNDKVYESLIIGALKFMGQQSAMHYYRDMIREGWDTNLNILHGILRDCCQKADWEGGLSTWHQISLVAEKVTQWTYYWMLRLCQIFRKHDVFYQVLQEGADQDALPAPMLKLYVRLGSLSSSIAVHHTDKLLRSALNCCIDTKAQFRRSGVEVEPPISAHCTSRFIKALRDNSIRGRAMKAQERHYCELHQKTIRRLVESKNAWNGLRLESGRIYQQWRDFTKRHNVDYDARAMSRDIRRASYIPSAYGTPVAQRTPADKNQELNEEGTTEALHKVDAISKTRPELHREHRDLKARQTQPEDYGVSSSVTTGHEQRPREAEAEANKSARVNDNNPADKPLFLLPPTIPAAKSLQIHDAWEDAAKPMVASA